jgi:CPA2 family monovalent cation:H+ antiporter-2
MPDASSRGTLDYLREMWTGQREEKPCSHRDMINDVQPQSDVCDECVASGGIWPELRMCVTCGYVGCCDDAENQHALKHSQATGHPLIRPHNTGIDWLWCYEDEALLDPPE